MVMPLDFTDLQDMELLVDTLQNFVKRTVPVRFGIVPLLSSPPAIKQTQAVYYLLDTYGLGAVIDYLSAVSYKIDAMIMVFPHLIHFRQLKVEGDPIFTI